MEYAIATQRLPPAAVGLIVAAFSVAVNPHGMVAVLPFLAGAKPLLHLVRRRAGRFAWSPVLAPITAAVLVVLVASFSDQTWRTVSDATAVRSEIGPSQSWYQELSRYTLLFGQSPDGSLTPPPATELDTTAPFRHRCGAGQGWSSPDAGGPGPRCPEETRTRPPGRTASNVETAPALPLDRQPRCGLSSSQPVRTAPKSPGAVRRGSRSGGAGRFRSIRR